MTSKPELSRAQIWLLAARPKTLPAAIAPVLVASALAYSHGVFSWLPALLCLLCSLLIQIATNFANDFQDYAKGSDREDRLGPIRVTSAGLLSPRAVQIATYATFAFSAIAGAYLMYVGGWPIIAIGILSILSGLAYTGGPYPLGYNGLGDIFVFAFFGLAAVCGTYYVQALTWSLESVVAAFVPGLFSVAILVSNNHRDYNQDIVSGKRTLAVKFGLKASLAQFTLCITIPYLVPVVQYIFFYAEPTVFLPYLTIPLAIKLWKAFTSAEGVEFNSVLAKTGGLLTVFSLLYSIGMVLEPILFQSK